MVKAAKKTDIPDLRSIPIGDVMPFPGNPRNNELAIDAVMHSIESFGFRVPIVVDGDMVIIAGHTRLAAAKKMGLTHVPVIIADDMTPQQIQAFRLVDNKTSELATWDFDMLATEVAGLVEAGIDLTPYGWTSEEVDCLREVVSDASLDASPLVDDGANSAVLSGRLGATHITADARSARVAVGEFNFFIGVPEYRAWADKVRQANGHDKSKIIIDLAGRLGMRDEYEAHDRKAEAKAGKKAGDRAGAEAVREAAAPAVTTRTMGKKPTISSSSRTQG